MIGLVTGCHHSAVGDADMAMPPPMHYAVDGQIWDAPCRGASQVSVRALSGGDAALTDARGRFHLEGVGGEDVLELRADGHPVTLTSVRSFIAPAAQEQLLRVQPEIVVEPGQPD